MQETGIQFLGQENPLEKEMATHSSILAWTTPWTEEPGGLQSMGLQEQDMTYWLCHRHHQTKVSYNPSCYYLNQVVDYDYI